MWLSRTPGSPRHKRTRRAHVHSLALSEASFTWVLTRKTGSRRGRNMYPYHAGAQKKPYHSAHILDLKFFIWNQSLRPLGKWRNLPLGESSALPEILEAKAIFSWEGWKPLYLALGIASFHAEEQAKAKIHHQHDGRCLNPALRRKQSPELGGILISWCFSSLGVSMYV